MLRRRTGTRWGLCGGGADLTRSFELPQRSHGFQGRRSVGGRRAKQGARWNQSRSAASAGAARSGRRRRLALVDDDEAVKVQIFAAGAGAAFRAPGPYRAQCRHFGSQRRQSHAWQWQNRVLALTLHSHMGHGSAQSDRGASRCTVSHHLAPSQAQQHPHAPRHRNRSASARPETIRRGVTA